MKKEKDAKGKKEVQASLFPILLLELVWTQWHLDTHSKPDRTGG